MNITVQRAKTFHDAAYYVLPVVASVAIFAVAIIQRNTALYAIAAGALGIPGVKAVTTNLATQEDE